MFRVVCCGTSPAVPPTTPRPYGAWRGRRVHRLQRMRILTPTACLPMRIEVGERGVSFVLSALAFALAEEGEPFPPPLVVRIRDENPR